MPRSNNTASLLSLNLLPSLSPVSWLPSSYVEYLFSGSAFRPFIYFFLIKYNILALLIVYYDAF